MRQIKFRAYDKKEKKWLLGYDLPSLGGFSMMGEMMMMGEYANMLSHYFSKRKFDDLVLMQFTGLLDKNGKEIYEGDLMNVPVAYLSDIKTVEVVWSKTGWFFDDGKALHSFFGELVERGEIIGNIYENPELIK